MGRSKKISLNQKLSKLCWTMEEANLLYASTRKGEILLGLFIRERRVRHAWWQTRRNWNPSIQPGHFSVLLERVTLYSLFNAVQIIKADMSRFRRFIKVDVRVLLSFRKGRMEVVGEDLDSNYDKLFVKESPM